MGRKGDATRAAILAAARERFARAGYEGATIRTIAADAGVDPAMVVRHFGSKDQLFAAAADFDLRLPDLSGLEPADLGRALIELFLDRWVGDEALTALLRAAATNPAAAERMRGIFADQLLPLVASFVPGDPARAAGLIATQVLGLALCRLVLKLPPVVELTEDELQAWIAPTLLRYAGLEG